MCAHGHQIDSDRINLYRLIDYRSLSLTTTYNHFVTCDIASCQSGSWAHEATEMQSSWNHISVSWPAYRRSQKCLGVNLDFYIFYREFPETSHTISYLAPSGHPTHLTSLDEHRTGMFGSPPTLDISTISRYL